MRRSLGEIPPVPEKGQILIRGNCLCEVNFGCKPSMFLFQDRRRNRKVGKLRSSPTREVSLGSGGNHAIVWQFIFIAVTVQLFVRPRLEPVVFDLVCKDDALPK